MNDPEKCPLCGEANECQLCTASAYKGLCWCEKEVISDELLAQVPEALRGKACVCKECVKGFQEERSRREIPKIRPGDFYFDSSGLVVFTEAYHRRRGYCCANGCRHCPYPR